MGRNTQHGKNQQIPRRQNHKTKNTTDRENKKDRTAHEPQKMGNLHIL